MPDTGKDYKEPAESRVDLARQTAEATRGKVEIVQVEEAGADALVEAAEQDLPAEETNERIAAARQSEQDRADAARGESEGEGDKG